MHAVAEDGTLEMVQILVEAGADVNAKNRDGKTPLDLAHKNKHRDVEKLLRKHGAK